MKNNDDIDLQAPLVYKNRKCIEQKKYLLAACEW